MTPFEIKTFLHIATIAEPLVDSPLMNQTLASMYGDDLISKGSTPCGWKLNPRGQCYLFMLTNLPLPKPVFVDNYHEIIPYEPDQV